MKKPFLSEVINFSNDIEPYKFINIYSGVGSGKNTWVQTLAEQGYNILLITSRKATADAQASKLNGSRWINLEEIAKYDELAFGNPKQIIVTVTNAGIEQFLKNKYSRDDEKTHLWRYFDFIILDEAHSLIADSLFSDSPFHVKTFMAYGYCNYPNCKYIFMTGTPDSMEPLFRDNIKQSENYKHLNLYEQCNHVYPKEIIVTSINSAERDLAYEITKRNKKVIYFANSITRMETMVKKLLTLGLKEDEIGIAYSQNQQRDFPQSMLEYKETLRDTLVKTELLPPHIKLFLTTSQNKEGININNTDIGWMVSESCDKSSLIQMAGRIRHGLEALIIFYDAPLHSLQLSEDEISLDKQCLQAVNTLWDTKEFIEPDFISMVERKFPTIRYNILRERFQSYREAEIMFNQQNAGSQLLQRLCYQQDYSSDLEELQSWFPLSEITLYRPQTTEEAMSEFNQILSNYIEQHKFYNIKITHEEKEQFKVQLNEQLAKLYSDFDYSKLNISFPVKSLNSFLKKFGYIMAALSHHKNCLYILKKKDN